ncbi:MFS transporter [Streptomyces sp. NPDC014894]|uniref:MFS transporter n=1 Tax=Streptomyces sp. NPDC014894 TaxID=3364931 RepID=UPI0036F5E063
MTQEPAPEQGHPRRWTILAALCSALLVIVIDNTVLNVAMPSIGRAFDASAGQLQAVLDAYVVVFGGLLVTAGVVSDRYGRRRTMAIGLVVFGLTSLGAVAAQSVWWLIAMRAAMGVGAALVMPATLAVIVQVFPARERPRAFAAWAAVASAAMGLGPLLGGVLVDRWSWAGVFLINLPMVAAALYGTLRLVPESRDPVPRPPDPLGAVLITSGMVALVWAVISVPEHGPTAGPVLASLALALAALFWFGVRQLRAAEPMVDLSLYRDRRFAGAGFAIALLSVATGSTLFVLSQYLQLVVGLSATMTGLAVAPLAVGVVLGSVLGGRAPARIGARACVVAGFAVTGCGFAVLASLSADSPYAVVAAGLLLCGAGTGFAGPAGTTTVLSAVPPHRAGMGSALNDTHQQMGIALGVAVLGGLLTGVYRALLPADVPAHARDSPARTLAYARERPDGAGLAHDAREAFAQAQSLTMASGLLLALAGAAVALITLRTGPETPGGTAAAPAATGPRPDKDSRTPGTPGTVRTTRTVRTTPTAQAPPTPPGTNGPSGPNGPSRTNDPSGPGDTSRTRDPSGPGGARGTSRTSVPSAGPGRTAKAAAPPGNPLGPGSGG